MRCFFFTPTSSTEIFPLSLHDALPISGPPDRRRCCPPIAPCPRPTDRKSTRLNSSHVEISYAVFCLKKKNSGYKENLDHILLLMLAVYSARDLVEPLSMRDEYLRDSDT